MAILKKTKSGNALMFIDDLGNAYTIAVKIVSAILGNYQRGEFAVLTRLPMQVSVDRFPQSPVFMSPDTPVQDKGEELTTTNDALSQRQNKKNSENFSKFDDIQV